MRGGGVKVSVELGWKQDTRVKPRLERRLSTVFQERPGVGSDERVATMVNMCREYHGIAKLIVLSGCETGAFALGRERAIRENPKDVFEDGTVRLRSEQRLSEARLAKTATSARTGMPEACSTKDVSSSSRGVTDTTETAMPNEAARATSSVAGRTLVSSVILRITGMRVAAR